MATQAEIRLGVFRAALAELGDRSIADTGETIEPARVLVQNYDKVVQECLAEGSWNFATETVKLAADTGVTPAFGHTEVFGVPSDLVRVVGVSGDENFSHPLMDYDYDSNYISAASSPIYVRYISNDTGMGLELTRWPQNFTRYVELELATRVCTRLTQNAALKDTLKEDRDRARRKALNHDSMNTSQPRFPPQSNWGRSRYGRSGGGDRGSRAKFTG